MTEYLAVWPIEIGADTPEQAARTCLDIQQDPNSSARHFLLWDARRHQIHSVDLVTGITKPLPVLQILTATFGRQRSLQLLDALKALI